MNKSKNKSAYYTALNILNKKDYTKKEIINKLTKKGFDTHSIEETIKKLVYYKLIDDERYTEIWLKEKIRNKPIGKRKILYDLSKKGISTDIIYNKLKVLSYNEEELAYFLFDKKIHSIESESIETKKRKIYNYLATRGFPNNIILNIINSNL